MEQNSVLQKAMYIGTPTISHVGWSLSVEITEQGIDHRVTELSTRYVHEKGICNYRLHENSFPVESGMSFFQHKVLVKTHLQFCV